MDTASLRALLRSEPCPCGGEHWVLRVVPSGHFFGPFVSRDAAGETADMLADMISAYGPMVGPMFGVDLDAASPDQVVAGIIGAGRAPACGVVASERLRALPGLAGRRGDCSHGNPFGRCPEGCL